MKILINTISLLSPFTGAANYTYQIARNLTETDLVNEYLYFYRYYSKKLKHFNKRSNFFYSLTELARNIPFLRTELRKLKRIGATLKEHDFDLYFEPNFIPLDIKAKKTVVTVFDFSFKVHPEWHPKDRVLYFENNFWNNIDRADRIIVISNFVKESAINLFGFKSEKLKTIYLGYDTNVFRSYPKDELVVTRKKYSLPENFILFAGSIEPRKNLNNLIQAYAALDDSVKKEFKLVLAGFKGWKNKEVQGSLRRFKNNIILLGYLPEKELGKLYNLAALFVYPSFYEGFGLPPLEAMACGCPVVVSNTSSMPEVCSNAAYYVDPYDSENIAAGLKKVLMNEELKRSLRQSGLERAAMFSWRKSAEEHLLLFQELEKMI
ncbi:MAG TPA: glycosyltransferase family 1 protein [bacterium]